MNTNNSLEKNMNTNNSLELITVLTYCEAFAHFRKQVATESEHGAFVVLCSDLVDFPPECQNINGYENAIYLDNGFFIFFRRWEGFILAELTTL